MNYTQTAATTQIKVGSGRICSLTFSSTSTGTITIYDEAQGGTTNKVFATLTPAAGSHYYFGDEGIVTNNGIYIVIANTLECTIGWK